MPPKPRPRRSADVGPDALAGTTGGFARRSASMSLAANGGPARSTKNNYAGPVLEQAINQIVQVTPLEQVNERIHEITELVRGHLQDFLSIYGIVLNDVKVLIRPKDERMRELISLRAFGLSELDAVRYYVALKMAERGLVSAPNVAVGQPFNYGITSFAVMPGLDSGTGAQAAPAEQ